MLFGAPAVLSGALGGLKAVGGALSSFTNLFSKHPKDKARIEHERDMTQKALAGDVNAARDMYGHKSHAATAAAKAAAQAGWDEVVRLRPDVAREAERLGALPHPGNYAGAAYIGSPLLNELGRIGSDVRSTLSTAITDTRETLAGGVQRIGAGATNVLATSVAPDGTPLTTRVTIPTDAKTLALIALAIGVLVFLAFRR